MEFKTAKYIDAGHQRIEALGADGQIYKIPADEGNADYRRLLDGSPDEGIKAVNIARFRTTPKTDARLALRRSRENAVEFLEAMFDAMEAKGAIALTDLPAAAQKFITGRRANRKVVAGPAKTPV